MPGSSLCVSADPRHTENGLIITWARPGLQGLGTANPPLGTSW